MREDIKKRWVAALTDDSYLQGKHKLRNGPDNTFCCLGVLVDLAVQDGVCEWVEPEVTRESGYTVATGDMVYEGATVLPLQVAQWAGLDAINPVVETSGKVGLTEGEDSLAGLNDAGVSFKRIAKLIKEQL